MTRLRLAHVAVEFDYAYGNPDNAISDDASVVDAITRIVAAGLWRSALSDFPTITVTVQPLYGPDHPAEGSTS